MYRRQHYPDKQPNMAVLFNFNTSYMRIDSPIVGKNGITYKTSALWHSFEVVRRVMSGR